MIIGEDPGIEIGNAKILRLGEALGQGWFEEEWFMQQRGGGGELTSMGMYVCYRPDRSVSGGTIKLLCFDWLLEHSDSVVGTRGETAAEYFTTNHLTLESLIDLIISENCDEVDDNIEKL